LKGFVASRLPYFWPAASGFALISGSKTEASTALARIVGMTFAFQIGSTKELALSGVPLAVAGPELAMGCKGLMTNGGWRQRKTMIAQATRRVRTVLVREALKKLRAAG
jgi:hypothetical protein